MNICVYGASSDTLSQLYIDSAELLGEKIAEKKHGLVFGGGAHGVMGGVCRGVHRRKGYILGIAPSFFNKDGILSPDCTEFIYTQTMRERKQLMEDRSDAFIAAPGGIGTFEEFFEILTLKQLGQHNKPIAVYNVNGYYDSMAEMLEKSIVEGFMKPQCRDIYKIFANPDEILDYIEACKRNPIDVTHLKNI